MCKSKDIRVFLDLGYHPHSDYFPREDELHVGEVFFPLRLVTCDTCGLMQIDHYVSPEYMYQYEYLYQQSTTKTGTKHYTDMAKEVVEEFGFGKGDLAVDIGSNVGVLLQGFKDQGMRVLGVDPAEVARKAIENGIDTVIDFFTEENAVNIAMTYGKAKVISGTNVFAHLHDLDDAVKGIVKLLHKDGVIVIEAPYAVDLVEHVEYDTVYHQHIGYLSVKPMQFFFDLYGLELFNVKKQDIHGGTIRYYIGWKGKHTVQPSVQEYIDYETNFGLYDAKKLDEFAGLVRKQKMDLLKLVVSLKEEGKTVFCLSTPAKGNTLLNYCGLDASLIDFATERNPLKVGRYTPGTHIPIYHDDDIVRLKPDYAIILAWNFADEIMKNMEDYKKAGGKFIIPIPYPKII